MRIVAAGLLLTLALPAAAAERSRADVACAPIPDENLDYACTIRLTDPAGKPVEGADISVGADMPSMPMAHNVAPVKAKASAPGVYEARLALEMHGVWAVKLRLGPPHNDLIVRRLRFGPGKVDATSR
ncbi:MAG: hypothetical protein A2X52_02275 [Candidatus Rokubacteria bacterium GWC2_70_16]|nr:MAG: hypothetical protein A2X52_02275 [Candidatus Rokubacteria bacterium GWC2_70_16]OGL14277.1 MAG: hypothetical protein A3K12_06980 [Candidatus Rokubacteria bacterium RIFCSPLOWO2_12_FULL_71_19]